MSAAVARSACRHGPCTWISAAAVLFGSYDEAHKDSSVGGEGAGFYLNASMM